MTIDNPAKWSRQRRTVEADLWALDVATGTWLSVYDHWEECVRRPEDFIHCGFIEAARIYAGGLMPVASVDKQRDIADKCQQGRVA